MSTLQSAKVILLAAMSATDLTCQQRNLIPQAPNKRNESVVVVQRILQERQQNDQMESHPGYFGTLGFY